MSTRQTENQGYIKYWRSNTDHKLYFSEPFTKWQAWTDLLLMANYKNNVVDIRGILVEVKRGQVFAGQEFLASRWKWSRGKVRRFLRYLEQPTVQQIVQQKSNVITIITIVNYEYYQGPETENSTADGPLNDTTDGTTDGHTKERLRKTKKIEELYIREQQFKKDVMGFSGQYPAEMLEDFIRYWTEQDRGSSPKMRFEKQKTWETSKRLMTWAKNNKEQFNDKRRGQGQPGSMDRSRAGNKPRPGSPNYRYTRPEL